MKKTHKFFGLFLIAIMVNVSTSSILPATTYICEEGGCTTTINDYGDGYNWSILCDDGGHSSGNVSGAEYGGNCPQAFPEQN
ncbi:MAG: hypothetical protein WD512_19390 [Candidatus Paceibacterota bacterium]